jgi:hypothetical protein
MNSSRSGFELNETPPRTKHIFPAKIQAVRFVLFLALLPSPLQSHSTFKSSEVSHNDISMDFPNSATFSAEINSESEIVSVLLEYGNKQLTCGDVIAKAFPQFTPGNNIEVSWTWDMRQSGSLPTGTQLWWRWRYTDAGGNEQVSETRSATWMDPEHEWQTLASGKIQLHWYEGGQDFAQDLMNAAKSGLDLNAQSSGLTAEAPIDIYIYSGADELKNAILYEPAWTGGMAYPEFDIVLIGIAPVELEWGRDAMVHELTHVLVGHQTFSCLGDVPTWLNEGLAVYSEGELDPADQAQLTEAIKSDTLLSVRSLSGSFSEVTDKAYLSYSESYSLVKYLIESHGQEKMTTLLLRLRDGETINQALIEVYGFDVDGLEDAWRKAISAAPRSISTQPTSIPSPTHVPTIVPISGLEAMITPTPYFVPTSTFQQELPDVFTNPLTPIFICLACLILLSMIILGSIAMRAWINGRKQQENNQFSNE